MWARTRKDHATPAAADIRALVEVWLDEPTHKFDGGTMVAVTDSDMAQLDNIIRQLVKRRFEGDCDGDRALRWALLDWNVEQPTHFRPLPSADDTLEEAEARLDSAMFNLSIAMESVRQCIGGRDCHRERARGPRTA